MERDRLRLVRRLPERLAGLAELALDMRWTWNHEADELWRRLDRELWDKTENAWFVLQNVSSGQLAKFATDPLLVEAVDGALALRRAELARPSWFDQSAAAPRLSCVAYFSMEFGLSEALPLYAGGLGVLAGDMLKAASDLGVPIVGIGLLYQSGYFRQLIDVEGNQRVLRPYNNPMLLPILPTLGEQGEWKQVSVQLPGRALTLRCWEVIVGRVKLYLLDSNDPLNAPADRGITGELYSDVPELRLQQEIVLGIGGARLLEALGLRANVLHLNEGHAAFALLERARAFMDARGLDFQAALTCTRAGNLFTTHTAVADAFDRFAPELMERYFADYARELGLDMHAFLALGRTNEGDAREHFAMPVLALRGAGHINGVSRLHGVISREIFQPLFPRWPSEEIPVTHVTNGVHTPTWDSQAADRVWERFCGKPRWLGELDELQQNVRSADDVELWQLRNGARRGLIDYVRQRAADQFASRSHRPAAVDACARLLDPDVLTIGFARRFASYKRPTLLLHDPARLIRLLENASAPVQLVIAGKAHPSDPTGARLLHDWNAFLSDPRVQRRAIFLEDYDLSVSLRLVQGVDVWLNTPRRPFEACGTSGMKVLVNGGLNLSVKDGWWDELYAPDVGYAIGDSGAVHQHESEAQIDARDAASLYRVLEEEIVPEFYTRDERGIPLRWLRRVRESMAVLTPACSANRMVREYVTAHYAPLAAEHEQRIAADCALGRDIAAARSEIALRWPSLRFGELKVATSESGHTFDAQVYLDSLGPDRLSVEVYAAATGGHAARVIAMERGAQLSGVGLAFTYHATVPADRPASDYTLRIVPRVPHAFVPLELSAICWQR